MVHGLSIKAIIQEKFQDGIMSAINFKAKVDRVPDPKGDRVVITLDGKVGGLWRESASPCAAVCCTNAPVPFVRVLIARSVWEAGGRRPQVAGLHCPCHGDRSLGGRYLPPVTDERGR